MKGTVAVIGIGPGSSSELSPRARHTLERADLIVGYSRYIALLGPVVEDKETFTSGMRKEKERAQYAVEAARKGRNVCVVSGGDAGVYGLAGLVLELCKEEELSAQRVQVIPGITAATAAAALLGAPLMHDFAVISLSDLLTDRELIERRLALAAEGDFVTVLYNPKSRRREELFYALPGIFLPYRNPETPVGIVSEAGREGEKRIITVLGRLTESAEQVHMGTTVIIGNSTSYGKGPFIITPRGYTV
jgi:precorrin-3B C17-methyltransferase